MQNFTLKKNIKDQMAVIDSTSPVEIVRYI
jgi:hypothetical protein